MGPWRVVAVLVLLVAVFVYYANGPSRVVQSQHIGHIVEFDTFESVGGIWYTTIASDDMVITVDGKVVPKVGANATLRLRDTGSTTLVIEGLKREYRVSGISVRHLNRARNINKYSRV